MGQLRSVIEQINIGQAALNNKLKGIGGKKIKLLAVKRFNRTQVKLKGYLIYNNTERGYLRLTSTIG